MAALKSISLRIGGMTCVNCRNRIEQKLQGTVGVEAAAVNFSAGTADLTYDPAALTPHEIRALIEGLGYTVLDDGAGPPRSAVSAGEIAGTLIIILALFTLLRRLGLGSLTGAFPLAEAGMGYGMLFIIGLVTSVHCAAMCGGINLSQCIPASAAGKVPAGGSSLRAWAPAVLYNAGRVVSYTVLGTIVGALGSVLSPPGELRGLVQLAAGAFMVIMGFNMLGFFPPLRRLPLHLPVKLHRALTALGARKNRGPGGGRNPLLIGLLNGFMPCGPLQAMQLYALSTGSPVAGGLSMFLFSMGTVPLMFGLGALGSLLSTASRGRKFAAGVMRAGAILVTVMGMTMFTYGFGLSGFSLDFARPLLAAVSPAAVKAGWQRDRPEGAAAETPVRIEAGVQLVSSTLSPGRYPAITVQAGIPVRWTINAPAGSINGCNNRMIIREYRIEHRFQPGENLIEFTPEKTGRFSYSCWMGMIRSSITVVEEGQAAEPDDPELNPVPAGVRIPTEALALAEIQGTYQTVTIKLRDDGLDPALVVVQRGIPAAWTINNDSLDPGNRRLIFPAYYTQLDMDQGDNVIQLMPGEDFDFSTVDNVFYGYVKVVDDLSHVDVEAVKREAAEFETLVYPVWYFEAAAPGGSCCVK
jgi:sulfite exporter TauE/SafE/copper chaperone CopZ/plastocyanin domain-containing protein